jgi:hypothetical protein
MASDFYDQIGHRFDGINNRALNKRIGEGQRDLLREFFGSDLEGAEERMQNFQVPEGLDRLTLEIYGEIARRRIAVGKDDTGVQDLRFKLVLKPLETYQQ